MMEGLGFISLSMKVTKSFNNQREASKVVRCCHFFGWCVEPNAPLTSSKPPSTPPPSNFSYLTINLKTVIGLISICT